jgi:hypothetical protein
MATTIGYIPPKAKKPPKTKAPEQPPEKEQEEQATSASEE